MLHGAVVKEKCPKALNYTSTLKMRESSILPVRNERPLHYAAVMMQGTNNLGSSG
jgi:hypothetical protein